MMRRAILMITLGSFGCSGAAPLPQGDAGARDGGVLDAGNDGGFADGGSSSPLIVNEVVAEGDPSDWFELYNPTSTAIDLTGYTFTDDLADPGKAVFPQGTAIAALGYHVTYLDGVSPGFKLGADEEVWIFDPTGERIDGVDWALGDSPMGSSFGRFPNATGPFVLLAVPTPGAANGMSGCGDARIEGTELCDRTALGSGTCLDFGYTGGQLACAADCASYDTGACTGLELPVVINEVSSSNDDPIELYGVGPGPVDLAGWYVVDEAWDPANPSPDHRYDLGAIQLAAGDYLVLRKGTNHVFGLGDPDVVELYDDQDRLRDTATWVAGEATESWCRLPNGSGAFAVCGASFGNANHGALPAVVINEVSSEGDDQIELYNPGPGSADLSGWSVADDGYVPTDPLTADHRFALPAGTTIGGDGYLVLVKGTDHSFGLGTADTVALLDPSGATFATVTWVAGAAAPSYGRIPNGTGAFTTCSAASFGGSNVP